MLVATLPKRCGVNPKDLPLMFREKLVILRRLTTAGFKLSTAKQVETTSPIVGAI